MIYLILFGLGLFVGITLMCCLQINTVSYYENYIKKLLKEK